MVVQRDVSVSRRDLIVGSVTSLAAAAFSSGVVFGRETDFEKGSGQITGSLMAGDIHPGGATIWSKGQSTSRFFVEYSHFPDFKDARVIEGQRASKENDYTGKAVLSDLSPGQDIFYRVHFRDDPLKQAQRIGHFKTPALVPQDVTFLWSGDLCGQGYGFDAQLSGTQIFRSMRSHQPDFYINSGDYIYADQPIQRELVSDDGKVTRQFLTEEKAFVAQTVDQFRGNYRYNLHDPALREFFQSVPVYMEWDDHEVLNNWYPGGQVSDSRYQTREHTLLAAMGRQAFLDYLPVTPRSGGELYNSFSYGPLLDVFRIDLRSHRDANSGNLEGAGEVGARIFGSEQIVWLKEQLRTSRGLWKVIASDMPLGLVVPDGAGRFEGLANADNGLPRGRERELADLLSFIKREGIANIIWLTADVHYAAAHHYDPDKAQFKDFNGFWEFVAGPLHSGTYGPNKLDATFGPRVEFQTSTEGMKQNHPPSAGLQFYGMVKISSATKDMTVSLVNSQKQVLFSRTLPAALR